MPFSSILEGKDAYFVSGEDSSAYDACPITYIRDALASQPHTRVLDQLTFCIAT